MVEVLIIGGGLSGLTAAWRLMEAGLEVRVIEAAGQPGGHIGSLTNDGYIVEQGPHSFMPYHDHVWRLIDELGLRDQVLAASAAGNRRYIYRGGRLHPAPLSPLAFLATRLLSTKAKLRLMAEPFIARGGHPDETAAEFFVRRFGAEGAHYLAHTFISGVYAGDPARLGARAAFPKFQAFEAEHGSMIRGALHYGREKKRERAARPRPAGAMFSFADGLGQLARTLGARLGARLELSRPARSLAWNGGAWQVETASGALQARTVIVAVPPPAAAIICRPTDARLAELLAAIPMAPVAVAHLGGPDDGRLPRGFGCLIPRGEGLRALGIIFMSQLYPRRAPPGEYLSTVFIGGMLDPQAIDLGDDELRELAIREHRLLLGESKVERTSLIRHRHAIPQLTPEHPRQMKEIDERLAQMPGTLRFAGNYLSGVGVEQAAQSGYAAAESIIAARAAGRT